MDRTRSGLGVMVLVAAAVSLTATSPARADDCADMVKYSKDVYAKWHELGRKYGCDTPVRVAETLGACYLPKIITGIASEMLGWWNNAANNSWATVGPRTLGISPEVGDVVLGTKRTFLTALPAQTNVTITLDKLEGSAETEVTVCKLEETGRATRVDLHTFPHSAAPAEKVFRLSGAGNALVAVKIDNRSATNKFKYRIEATFDPIKTDTAPVTGTADIHLHLPAHLAFGADWLWNPPDETLRTCDGKHAAALFKAPNLGKDSGSDLTKPILAHGTPPGDWPHYRDTAHQQAQFEALKKAHAKGLNLVVVTPVSNEFLCSAMKAFRPNPAPCDDMAAAHEQIDYLWKFADRNKDWFEIAVHPWHARQIIHGGKLAAIISIEVGDLMPKEQGDLSNQLDRLWFKGLRSLQPVHETDSEYAGAAHQKGFLFRILDVIQSKNPVALAEQAKDLDTSLAAWLFDKGGKLVGANEQVLSKNSRGLTRKGEQLIAELIRRQILIDSSHLSEKAISDTFNLLRGKHKGYPMYSSHSRFQATLLAAQVYEQGEYLTTPEQAGMFRELGGIVGIRTGPEGATPFRQGSAVVFPDNCPGSATTIAQSLLWARRVGRVNVAFGSDMNGFVPQTGPRSGDERCPAQPATSRASLPNAAFTGSRTSTGYRTRGLASVEFLPDLVTDMQEMGVAEAAHLNEAAENFLKMWERAWELSPPGGLVPGSACRSNAECPADNYCDKGAVFGVGMNQCKPKTADGKACSTGDQCASGQCRFLQCAAAVGSKDMGQACNFNSECRIGKCSAELFGVVNGKCVCDADPDCGTGRYCDKGVVAGAGTNTCKSRLAAGQGCARGEQCSSGQCKAAQCVAAAGSKELGQGCNFNSECRVGKCSAELWGVINGTCVCDSNDDCGADRFCDTGGIAGMGKNKCVARKGGCASCKSASECQSGMVCKEDLLGYGKCIRVHALDRGASCCRDDQCRSGKCKKDQCN